MAMKWLLVFIIFPSLVYASENCAVQFKGICRDKCTAFEVAAEGAFIDCTDKEECCVPAEKEQDKKDMGGSKDNKPAPEISGPQNRRS